ncbi:hypothetical protein Pmani_018779 [Petrolisthes manimaculis]|uniref:Uncharacterized protein n=1 Tax=Petrolisthes manimaculis TaxID=1843537 RepID=A0AAE1PJ27_9EUCA|nr:hypothetical protein Pmani_018779 [Petrolisthes manimaculis]
MGRGTGDGKGGMGRETGDGKRGMGRRTGDGNREGRHAVQSTLASPHQDSTSAVITSQFIYPLCVRVSVGRVQLGTSSLSRAQGKVI